ncbi:uncharacterized protein LOC103575426 [Microplitis demolitor]|uniref:uncharacterized protein LOC103575426 n=1 Tax=Microplitis demolitor TaxID=69319 RepID=UPI0004CDB393|nr:uncharacterized protein LOC103575426 [Microplitis demolitor]
MCEAKTKLSFFIIIIIIISITIDAINVSAKNQPLVNLSVGSTLNINNLNSKSVEIIGNLFSGTDKTKYIKKNNYPEHYRGITISKVPCLSLESLKLYNYLKINVYNNGEYSSYNTKLSNNINFGIPQAFMRNNYFYGVIEICRIKKIDELNIKVIDEYDFFNMDTGMNYNILLNATAIFHLRNNRETHYVSSITTGNCFYQFYVNEEKLCNVKRYYFDIDKINNFFEFPLYKSHITTASRKKFIMNWRKNYDFSNNINYSLHKFSGLTPNDQLDIINRLGNDVIISLELKPLFEMPKTEKKQKELQADHYERLAGLRAGDIININDLRKINSRLKVNSIDVSSNRIAKMPILKSNYTNCYEYNETRGIYLQPINYTSHYGSQIVYDKINLFEEIIKRKYYGVKRKYLNENYKCLKITICSEMVRRKTNIEFLNEKSKNDIFFNKNIVLGLHNYNKTHYVAKTERGQCLFQTLIYPVETNNRNEAKLLTPVYTGKILSANNNNTLENLVQKRLNGNGKDLWTMKDDPIDILFILNEFRYNYKTNINIFLKKTY